MNPELDSNETSAGRGGRRQSPVDLHTHSRASDGELAPAALVAHAAQAGVRMLALTDHDSVSGIDAAQDAAYAAGIRLIPGIELSANWESKTLHIVGLGIDPTDPVLRQMLAIQQQSRRVRAQAMAEKVERLGVVNALQRAEDLAAGGQITRSHFAQLLVEAGLCKDLKRAFRRYLGNGKPAYVSARWAGLDEATRWIAAAGGMAVLAHPRRYTLGSTARKRMLCAFREAGGTGLEVCCGTTDAAQIAVTAAEAQAYGFAGSVASDFHGSAQPWARIGGVAALPDGLPSIAEMLDRRH